MGKKKSTLPAEENLLLPTPPSSLDIVDTHTHLASTFEAYRRKYKEGKYQTVYDLVQGLYADRNVEAIVDVWCEAPVQKIWKELADSALEAKSRKDLWGGMEYWFVMGISVILLIQTYNLIAASIQVFIRECSGSLSCSS